MAMFSCNAFWVELHTMDGQAFMAKRHDMPIIAARINDQAVVFACTESPQPGLTTTTVVSALPTISTST